MTIQIQDKDPLDKTFVVAASVPQATQIMNSEVTKGRRLKWLVLHA